MTEINKYDGPIESGFDPRAQPILQQILNHQITIEQAGYPFFRSPDGKLGIVATREQLESITGKKYPSAESIQE